MADIRQRLEDSGHRITPQRLCILEALLSSEGHPSAEQIYGRVRRVSPTTSLATIYKTLDTLQELGEVRELEFRGDRHHYDGMRPDAHPHVVCTGCGRIEDVDLTGLQTLQGDAARASGFQIAEQRLEFYGLCGSCQGLLTA